MSDLALRLIEENKQTKDTFLDLGNCGLTELPEELFECHWLKELNLGEWYWDDKNNTWNDSEGDGLKNNLTCEALNILHLFKHLNALYLSNNQINNIEFLEDLTGLQYLDLSSNQIRDISTLQKLDGLKILDLSKNSFNDITYLKKLIDLQSLNLSDNRIVNHNNLVDLINLRSLYLRNNHISNILFLEKILHLENLYLSDNKISDISFLGKLTELRTLIMSHNKIIDSSPLKNITNLKILNLSYNKILDYRFLEKMPDLQELYLRNNKINNIVFLKKLKGLQILDLRLNQIQLFPEDLFNSLTHLRRLDLYGNPIQNIPQEVFNNRFSNGLYKIKDYFQSISNPEEIFPLYEAKLLLVGRGQVGKSELAEALIDNNYQFVEGRKTTEGIRIKEWYPSGCIEKAKEIDFKVNLWDFGGQEVYYGTHQFFLTKNSLYILVWDTRQEEDPQTFGYWLRTIGLLSEQSPVLVVQNKADERTKPLNQETLKKAFPFIVGFYQTSCKFGDGLPELRRDILKQLMQLPHIGEKWNIRRVNIRRRLEQDMRDFITEVEYLRICAEEELKEGEPVYLSSQLHALGVILHFQDDELLQNTVILKPEWATAAVYKIIDNKPIKDEQQGRFRLKDLKTVWHEAEYAEKRPNYCN